ncbi:MAG: polyprenyl synthetase family protein, partial [Rhizobiaceae bacterium]|nr:polyprenyl synthetase family protein [Rhizobiaceae bacterium]
ADYLKVIEAKTAALFAAATEVGPVVAEAGADARSTMRSYCLSLGLAFQLFDDVLDYRGTSAALGKNTGDDFREGKITLPVILSYQRGTETEKAFWRAALQDGVNGDDALAEARRLLERHGALEATIARARSFGEEAYAAAAALPRSEPREALLEVVEFCFDRAN